MFTDGNECEQVECRNGGSCENLENTYRCWCNTGWAGPHCETGLSKREKC